MFGPLCEEKLRWRRCIHDGFSPSERGREMLIVTGMSYFRGRKNVK